MADGADAFLAALRADPHRNRPLPEAYSAEAMIAAITRVDGSRRAIVIDQIGFRRCHRALPGVIAALDDPQAGVRGSAADVLGKLGDPAGGEALLRRIGVEDDVGVRRVVVAALGTSGHAAAEPALVALLQDPDESVRAFAARSLGLLGANAGDAIRAALAVESASFAKQQMRFALDYARRRAEGEIDAWPMDAVALAAFADRTAPRMAPEMLRARPEKLVDALELASTPAGRIVLIEVAEIIVDRELYARLDAVAALKRMRADPDEGVKVAVRAGLKKLER